MRRYSKNTKWLSNAWQSLKEVEQKPIMHINGLIHINVKTHPKVALRWFDMLEQKLREGKVETAYYKESVHKRMDSKVCNTFGIENKKFYMEHKTIYSGHMVAHKIFEMNKEEYEEYRCILHCFIHEQKQEHPKLRLLR